MKASRTAASSSPLPPPWWSPRHHLMQHKAITLQSNHPRPRTTLQVSSSKSMSMRAMLLAAVAQGRSTIHNLLRSDDTYWCLESLRKCGIDCQLSHNTNTLHITGAQGTLLPHPHHPPQQLYFGASGCTARFLTALLAASSATEATLLTADASLSARPIAALLSALHQLSSGKLELSSMHLPLALQGKTLLGGTTTLPAGCSSQFISAVLMAAPLAAKPITLHLTTPPLRPHYIAMSRAMMQRFGVFTDYHGSQKTFHITPQSYKAVDITMEMDLSSACYALAYAALHGTEVTLTDIPHSKLQADGAFVDVLKAMGCTAHFHKLKNQLTVKGPSQLRGGIKVDMSAMADQALTVGFLAPLADAPITLTGLSAIRHHECDRLKALSCHLKALGLKVSTTPSSITITPFPHPHQVKLPTTKLGSYNDHRVVMSLALLASRLPSLVLHNPQAVSKTFPRFFDTLEKLGCSFKKAPFSQADPTG